MDLFDHQDCVPNFAPMYAIWPLVLCTAQGGGDGRRGIFVELGANDGLAETNTLSMERCLGWRGVLIEGNVALFSRLRQSRSNQSNVLVHSAVSSHCSADGTIRFSDAPSETAGIVDADGFTPAGGRHRQSSPVPCKPLRSILDSALSWFGARRVDFASIDTEGSEDLVISSLLAPAQHAQSAAELSGSAGTLPGSSPESNALRAPSTDAHAVLPTVLLVEAVGPVDKDARVENSLLGAGYVRANELEVRVTSRPLRNRVYVLSARVQPRCAEFLKSPPEHLHTRCEFRRTAVSLRCGFEGVNHSFLNHSAVRHKMWTSVHTDV